MTFLQHCILYGFAGMLIWLVCYIGTSLQNNLVFQKYEDRFTAHGLAIKAVDVLFVLFLIATIFLATFKADYMDIPSLATIVGLGMSAEAYLSCISIAQQICLFLAEICLGVWLILFMVYSSPIRVADYIQQHVSKKNRGGKE